MKAFAWIAVAIVGYMVAITFALAAALGGAFADQQVVGSFPDGIDIGLDEEQARNATISLSVSDELRAPPLAVLAMVVSALGESEFKVVANKQGSGYCGVFQADPGNIACEDTELQARSFLQGGLGFQAGGAIHLAKTRPSLTPGTIAYIVEGSRSNFGSDVEAARFYDVHRPRAESIINAWRSGEQLVSAPMPTSATARDVLNNPRIGLSPGQRADVASGGLDPRLLATMAWIAQRHSFIVTALRRDHAPGTNHEAGRAFDIGAVDRWICRGGREDACATLVHELADIRGPLRSTEMIYLWDGDLQDPNFFARADHDDHLHVGWDR